MFNHHFLIISGVLLMLAALAAPANAAQAVPNPSTPVEFGAKLLVCNACHGDNGVPRDATIPVIWGQQENFLMKQLHDFQNGDRDSELMSWMANTLSQAEQGSAAAYFANKNWPARSAGPGATATSPPNGIAACQICHQQDFVGGLPGPRLAGQSYEYLVEAMRRYAGGERTNNADMVKLMEALPPAERDAMARYMSGL
jgi:cytochrome c553